MSLNWVIIGSDNGLLPVWCQAIIWTNTWILLTGPLGTNFGEILIGIQTFSFKKLHLKTLSAKCHLFCLSLNELNKMCHCSLVAETPVPSESKDPTYIFVEAKCHQNSYPTLAREFQSFRVWGKFGFRTMDLTDTPTNLANQDKVGHALDQSRSVQSRGPERAHQNNAQSWWLSMIDRRLSRQFWDN